jgi:chemotaxis protein MotB
VEQEVVIITKKAKGGHGGHHGGAWKVAFADFVTAMMALFIVLWIVGQNQATKAAIGQYFRNPQYFRTPGVFETTTGTVLPEETGLVPGTEEQEKFVIDGGFESRRAQQRQAQELLLGHLEMQLQTLLATRPELARLKDQVEISTTEEGLRIDLLEKDKSSFFDVGSTRLNPPAVALIRTIAEELRTLPNRITIEGHTDSRPYADPATYSNWELSTDRANSARRIIEKHGVQPERIEQVRGYAAKKLRYPENPYDIRNRRVSILIAYDIDV